MLKPRYGVAESHINDFEVAKDYIYSWFFFSSDAERFARTKSVAEVWDLELKERNYVV